MVTLFLLRYKQENRNFLQNFFENKKTAERFSAYAACEESAW